MKYINGEYYGKKETIDTAETYKEAKYLLNEYRIAFGSGWKLWISQKECK